MTTKTILFGNPPFKFAQAILASWLFVSSAPMSRAAFNFTFTGTIGPGAFKGPGDFATGDINGDGITDFVFTESQGNDTSHIGIRLGTGNGNFTSLADLDSPGNKGAIRLADINHDGKLDLVYTGMGDGTLRIRFGNGDGTFGPENITVQLGPTVSPSTLLGALELADIDGDGNLDAIGASANAGIRIAFDDGSGTFTRSMLQYDGAGGVNSMSVLDVTGDGAPDIVYTTRVGSDMNILSGLRATPVVNSANFAGGLDSSARIAVAKLGNSIVFALTENPDIGNGRIVVGRNPVAPTNVSVLATQYLDLGAPAIGDFDGDSVLDLAFVARLNPSDFSGTLHIMSGSASGIPFGGTPATYGAGFTCFGVYAANINSDSNPDILVAQLGRNAPYDDWDIYLNNKTEAPAIFAATNSARCAIGTNATFTFRVTGNPMPNLAISGALPTGISWSTQGLTGTLSGKPVAGSAGVYPLTITADNGVPPNAVQNFTLTVIDLRPVVGQPIIYNPKSSTATFEAFVNSPGGSPVTWMGFVYAPTAINSNPTLGAAGVIEWDYFSADIFAVEAAVNSLTPSTQYSVVAFAVNSFGTNYSAVTTFQTSAGPVGSLIVTTLQDITNTPGLNSLRDAVRYAYLLNDTATITFDPALFAGGPATFTVSGFNNAVDLSGMGGKLTIRGPQPGLLTFDGSKKNEIFHFGGSTVEIDNVTLSNSFGYGGAIQITGGSSLTVSNVVFINNYSALLGGAISSYTPLLIIDCTFTSNSAAYDGGAISAGGQLTVLNSSFVANRTGVDALGNTNTSGGAGGAINATGARDGFLVVNSTFVGNRANHGDGGALKVSGGINNSALLMASCTVAGNVADGAGGGVAVGDLTSQPVNFNNTIVSGNLAATNSNVDVYTNLDSPFLSSSITISNCLIDADALAIFGTNTLADNGGTTPTLAINPTGPAINAGKNSLIPAGTTTDQRGQPRINNGTVDIGAYEFQLQPPVITSANNAIFLTSLSNSFSVTATSALPVGLTLEGTLPVGVTFNADVLSGTPPDGSGGIYSLTVMATNGVAPNATQNFTLNVVEKSVFAAHPNFKTNGFGWSLNGDSINGGPGIANNVFTLTDGTGGENRSAWFRYPLYVGAFQASFTYQDVGGNGADGTAFVIQNSAAGTSAIGGGGGGMGYIGITPSVAVMMNIYAGALGGASGVLIATNGNGNGAGYWPTVYQNTAPVDLDAGNPIAVNLRYLNGNLDISLTDTVTSATYETNVAINIPAFAGTNVAYVGITGSEGGVLSHQTVRDFSYTPLPDLFVAQNPNGSLLLAWPASIYGFTVQSTPGLDHPTWTNVNATVIQSDDMNQVVIPSPVGAQFYRLVL